MKTRPNILWIFVLNLLLVTWAAGCGKSQQADVDVSAARQQLKSADPAVKQNACVELAKAGPEAAPAVPDLIPLLKDPDPLTRRLAAYALGQIGPQAKQAVPALKELMGKATERDVVTATVNALNAIDPTATGGAQIPNVSN